MEVYHWIVLILLIIGIIAICSNIMGTIMRTIIISAAVFIFAGFVWGTLSSENKTEVKRVYISVKTSVGNFFDDLFKLGESESKNIYE